MPSTSTSSSASRNVLSPEDVRTNAQALVAEGRTDEAFDLFVAALGAVLDKNRELSLLIHKLRSERTGKRSEKVDPGQLALLLEQLTAQDTPAEPKPEQVRADAEADADLEEELEESRPAVHRKRAPSVDRRKVQRCEHRVELEPEARTCPRCGQPERRIGSDTSRVLEYVPGHFVEHEWRLGKYACGRCKLGVHTAPGPVKPFGCTAAPSLLAHITVTKFHDHGPIHRQHRMFARSGVTVPVSTLADWIAGVGDLVAPVVDVLADRVRAAYVVRTDGSGLKVLDRSGPDHIQRGTMWCYVGDDRDVLFEYAETGKGEDGPWAFLAGRKGYVQADAANVFDRVYNGRVAEAIEVGCMAHARRRLVELKDTDCRVAYPLLLIRRLYKLEELADLKELSPDARAAQRQERSLPALEKLQRWMVATVRDEPPSSALAQAASYFVSHWAALTRFVEDGRLSLDNNLCERQIRDLALGRRNYLFAGSHDAARRSARLYSLMRTCAQHGVAPLPYLTDVIEKLAAGWPEQRMAELLPDRWASLHAHASAAAHV